MRFWLWLGIVSLAIGFVTGALGFGRVQAGVIGIIIALVAILIRFLWNVAANDFERHHLH